MADVKVIGIMSKPKSAVAAEIVPNLLAWLDDHGMKVRMDEQTLEYAPGATALPRSEVPDGCDLIMVLGGDGTLLSASRAMQGRDTPIFAVNVGGLGFLTSIAVEDLYPELERAIHGQQRIAPRRLLECSVTRGEETAVRYHALNDVVITKTLIARMMDLETHVDNHYVNTYRADGLIVATPTGSTAYSLSAGGPIMFPSVSALCITPICPHTLTARPVIVPDTSNIRISILAEDDTAYLTLDGQVGSPLHYGDQVLCRRSPQSVNLIRPPKMLFFDVLREKLKWGGR